MISGSCHCGAVNFEVDELPATLTSCNCSICHRLGGLWAYYDIDKVTIRADADATIRYIQGDRKLAMHTCRVCGCTTHWENLAPLESSHMGLNFRMCSGEVIRDLRIRHFDGANTGTYLD